jgi:hypothetical protein
VQCPICAQALEGGELVMVCTPCHRSLGGGLAVGATGEFKVPSEAYIEAAGASGERPHAVNVCSWCGKLESQVKKLLGRGEVALCNECVSLCSDILDAELGTDRWR